jgi:hypothetical protein
MTCTLPAHNATGRRTFGDEQLSPVVLCLPHGLLATANSPLDYQNESIEVHRCQIPEDRLTGYFRIVKGKRVILLYRIRFLCNF